MRGMQLNLSMAMPFSMGWTITMRKRMAAREGMEGGVRLSLEGNGQRS